MPHKIKSQTAFSHKNEFNALSMGQFLQHWNLEFIQAGPSRSADSAQFNFNSELLETTFFLYLTLASEMIIRAKSLHRNRNPQNAAKCGVFFFLCLFAENQNLTRGGQHWRVSARHLINQSACGYNYLSFFRVKIKLNIGDAKNMKRNILKPDHVVSQDLFW